MSERVLVRPEDGIAILVMGVSGSGKSTLGKALAAALGLPFLEGDDLHPAANVARMSAGIALDDADRHPWLIAIGDSLRRALVAGGAVASCSALKRSYRDLIRSRVRTPVAFVHPVLDEATLRARLSQRTHFMPLSLLADQLAVLETPGPDEEALVIDAAQSTERQLAAALDWYLPRRDLLRRRS